MSLNEQCFKELQDAVRRKDEKERLAAVEQWAAEWITSPIIEVPLAQAATKKKLGEYLAVGTRTLVEQVALSGQEESVIQVHDVTGSTAWERLGNQNARLYIVALTCVRAEPKRQPGLSLPPKGAVRH